MEKRIKILREAGARAYKDGHLEIIFGAPQRQPINTELAALAERAAADAAR